MRTSCTKPTTVEAINGEEAKRNPVVIPDDAPPLDAPDAVLHVDPYRRQLAILCALLFRQVPPFGLLVSVHTPNLSLRYGCDM